MALPAFLTFEDLSLQIFLTMYHGTLLAVFVYDNIIRNAVRVAWGETYWTIIASIPLGCLFILVILLNVRNVWRKVARRLMINFIMLAVMFVVRLVIGILDIIRTKDAGLFNEQAAEKQYVFIAMMIVHVFGVIGTFMLSRNATDTVTNQ